MEDGPPCFPRGSTCPVVLGMCQTAVRVSPTGLSPSAAPLSSGVRLPLQLASPYRQSGPALPQPPSCNGGGLLHMMGLGSSPFARRYSGNRCCFLFLGVLRCFSSPGSPPMPMCSAWDTAGSPAVGSPIRVPPDQRLLAAPRGVSPLAAPFFAPSRQGIHRVPLVA